MTDSVLSGPSKPKRWRRLGIAAAAVLAIASTGPAGAGSGDRTLKLYFGHTGERGEFTFKRNGRYDTRELQRLNVFLRDWRKNEPTKMDPHLFDLIWAIYQQSGSHDYIHVVSSYRSPETNAMLRKRSSGVAKQSQHMLGKAMDFYIPDVPIDKLRAIAMKMQVGGVGYYPRSGSPFVHADTGSVRAWPRMTRQQLIALFPNGETLHVPADGKPLPGFERAVAKYGKSKDVALAAIDQKYGGSSSRAFASRDTSESRDGGESVTVASWLKRVFNDGGDEGEDGAPAAAQPSAAPVMVAAAEIPPAPLPRVRPSGIAEAGSATAALDLLAGANPQGAVQLAYAPLPRLRPAEGEAAADPLADLAARMSVETPPPPTVPAAFTVEMAQLPALPSAADSSALAGLAMQSSSAEAAPVPGDAPAPRARPDFQLAYAAPEAAAASDETAVGALASASYSRDDTAILSRIASAHSVAEPQFAALAEPQPAKMPDLFAIPETVEEVQVAHGKKVIGPDSGGSGRQAVSQAGFFGRLFANVF